MPCGARFFALYDNSDGRFYDKSNLIADLQQLDMLGLKIASKRAHLGLGGNHSNWVEDEGLRRRPSGMEVTKHQG